MFVLELAQILVCFSEFLFLQTPNPSCYVMHIGLVDPLVHVANTCQGRLQGMALGALLLLSRGPPRMRTALLAFGVRGGDPADKKKHNGARGGERAAQPARAGGGGGGGGADGRAAPRVLACILSVMRVEAGQAQVSLYYSC